MMVGSSNSSYIRGLNFKMDNICDDGTIYLSTRSIVSIKQSQIDHICCSNNVSSENKCCNHRGYSKHRSCSRIHTPTGIIIIIGHLASFNGRYLHWSTTEASQSEGILCVDMAMALVKIIISDCNISFTTGS